MYIMEGPLEATHSGRMEVSLNQVGHLLQPQWMSAQCISAVVVL